MSKLTVWIYHKVKVKLSYQFKMFRSQVKDNIIINVEKQKIRMKITQRCSPHSFNQPLGNHIKNIYCFYLWLFPFTIQNLFSDGWWCPLVRWVVSIWWWFWCYFDATSARKYKKNLSWFKCILHNKVGIFFLVKSESWRQS